MAKKMTRGRAAMEKLRLRARTKYLESGGSLSMVQLSAEVGISRQTVTKWKQVDEWEKDLAEVRQEVDRKVKSSAAANLFESLAPEYQEITASLQIIDKIVPTYFYKTDSSGNTLRDANGNPQIQKPEAKDLRHLAAVLASNAKTMRLLTGQSTENIDQHTQHSGQVEHTQAAPGVLDTCMEKMANGELSHDEGQEALQDLAEAFQCFRGKVIN